MTSPFLIDGGSTDLASLQDGSFPIYVASAQVGNLAPGLPVRTDASHQLVGGIIQLTDCTFVPLVNPFVGNLQSTQFTQNGQPVAVVSQIALANAGAGTSLVNSAAAPLAVKSLTAGSNITFTSTATDIKIDSTNALVTLASAGGVETLVNDGIGPGLATKGLTAGAGITLTATATTITVANTDPGSAVSLASAGGRDVG